MAYRNLDEFLTRLEQAGDVARFVISQPEVGIPEIPSPDARKVHVFTDGNGTRIVRNLYGTSQRIEQALRVASLDLIAERLEQLLEIGKPGAVGVMVSRAMTMFSAIRTTINRRAGNEFQRLSFAEWRQSLGSAFDWLTSQPLELTLLTGGETPRMTSVAMRIQENEILGEDWPDLQVGETVALVIGSDPAFMIAAQAPLPDIIHRSYFASWLRDKPLDMMRLTGLELEVPSNAEAIIVATVKAMRTEATALAVEAVWVNLKPIYPQVDRAEIENIRDAFAQMMLPLIRRFLPGVSNIRLRGEFGVLTGSPHQIDSGVMLRQLWAIPISVNVRYWLLLPETGNLDDAVERLAVSDIVSISRLTCGQDTVGILLDAMLPRKSSEQDIELEQIFQHFKRGWLDVQPTGEL